MQTENELRALYRTLEAHAPTRDDLTTSIARPARSPKARVWVVPVLACVVVLALILMPTLLIDRGRSHPDATTGGVHPSFSNTSGISVQEWATIALDQAAKLGDPSPESAQVVKTTLAVAQTLQNPGSWSSNGSETVYAMVIVGHFTCNVSCFTAPGAPVPTGTRAWIEFDPTTRTVVGLGLGQGTEDLSSIPGMVQLPL